MNGPHLGSAPRVLPCGSGHWAAKDKERITRKDVLRQITEGCVRWLETLDGWSRGPKSRWDLPAFVFHFPVGPVLQLLEELRFHDHEAQARSPAAVGPYQSAFRMNDSFGFGQQKTYVDKSGKTGGIPNHIEPYAPRTQIDGLHL